jgi:hypothetical protein
VTTARRKAGFFTPTESALPAAAPRRIAGRSKEDRGVQGRSP